MFEDLNHPTLYLTSILDVYEVFEHLHMLGMPYIVTYVQVGAKSWKSEHMMEPKEHHGVMFEAVNHPTLYLTSILDVYEEFEPLHMLCMGIWVHS